MSTGELTGAWERLLETEWRVLYAVGTDGWDRQMVDYLEDKARLVAMTRGGQLPADLIARLALRQQQIRPLFERALRLGRKQQTYEKGGSLKA